MDVRHFFILEYLLRYGDSNVRDVVKKLWREDENNWDNRFEPHAWYYHATKYFKPLSRKGLIELNEKLDDDGRQTWGITPEGAELFIDAFNEGSVLSDFIYQNKNRKNEVKLLVSNL